jgi:hypothetical protein
MDFLLTTPEQHGFQDPTLELDEKRLDSWLDGLPLLNCGESARLVLNALQPLNEQQLGSDKRLRLLAVYRPTVSRLHGMAAPLQLRRQPLSQQQRQDTVNNVERLCLAMADGYKILIKEWYAAGASGRDARGFGVVLHGAAQQLTAALLHSYRFYRPQPPFVFLELNQLYRLAHQHGMQDQRGAGGADDQFSLATLYQAISLLALTDPFSAREGDADRYYRILLDYASHARMLPGNSWQGVPEGLYCVDLQSDRPPRHCVFLQPPVGGDDPYILEARATLQGLHQRLAAVPGELRAQCPEAVILRSLLPDVTPGDKRRSKRRADGRWIEVVMGLQPIHDWLLKRRVAGQADAVRWEVKDASSRGYRLAWEESAASVLAVGDLICVVADSAAAMPGVQLLVVRWVRDERGEGTELGVEMFDGDPDPVRVTATDQPYAETHPALLLSSSTTQGCVAQLITPAQLYQEQRPLTIHMGGAELPVQCARSIEQAAGFDCFEFAAVGK